MKHGCALHLTRQHAAALVEHAISAMPAEACGLLAGRSGHVEKMYIIPNISPYPQVAFLMEPKAQLRAMLDIEAQRLELLVVYHSHPPGSRTDPSPADIRESTYPGAISLIVVPNPDDQTATTRAFVIDNAHATEIPIILVADMTPTPSSYDD